MVIQLQYLILDTNNEVSSMFVSIGTLYCVHESFLIYLQVTTDLYYDCIYVLEINALVYLRLHYENTHQNQ